MSRPNVLFIFGDQWRTQALGYAGNPDVKTPHIDRFAAQSVNFRHAVANTPVCSPSRASLLTGVYPHRHGVFLNDVPLIGPSPTLGEAFKAGGYETGYIGKWHLNANGRSAYIPRERRKGFDHWLA